MSENLRLSGVHRRLDPAKLPASKDCGNATSDKASPHLASQSSSSHPSPAGSCDASKDLPEERYHSTRIFKNKEHEMTYHFLTGRLASMRLPLAEIDNYNIISIEAKK